MYRSHLKSSMKCSSAAQWLCGILWSEFEDMEPSEKLLKLVPTSSHADFWHLPVVPTSQSFLSFFFTVWFRPCCFDVNPNGRDVVHGRPFPTSALSMCTLEMRVLGLELGIGLPHAFCMLFHVIPWRWNFGCKASRSTQTAQRQWLCLSRWDWKEGDEIWMEDDWGFFMKC